ncbi:hypothetical protein SEA_NICEHOUSE_231 [Rhodococcus phage NiceHouse]|nr:hypothetical protein SEA_NICEHOUSE_231 [Rhodococcus phage NiceHouse]
MRAPEWFYSVPAAVVYTGETMEEIEQLDQLLDTFGGVGVRIGRITQSLATNASVVDQILFYDEIRGLEHVGNLLRDAIFSYFDARVDELDLMEKLFDKSREVD